MGSNPGNVGLLQLGGEGLHPPLGSPFVRILAPPRCIAVAALAVNDDESVRGHQYFAHLRAILALYGCGEWEYNVSR